MNGDKNWLINWAAPQLNALLLGGWDVIITPGLEHCICNIARNKTEDWRKADLYQGDGVFVADAILDAYEKAYADNKVPTIISDPPKQHTPEEWIDE